MKISDAEINAANYQLTRYEEGRGNIQAVKEALEAAYTVRKQRKAAKRERQRKEKDKQVVESVKAPCKAGEIIKIDFSDEDLRAAIINGLIEPTPSKAPEWDGAFGVGEWEMRNGCKQTIRNIDNHPKWPLNGMAGRCYDVNGRYYGMTEQDSEFDLIRPWPKGEQ